MGLAAGLPSQTDFLKVGISFIVVLLNAVSKLSRTIVFVAAEPASIGSCSVDAYTVRPLAHGSSVCSRLEGFLEGSRVNGGIAPVSRTGLPRTSAFRTVGLLLCSFFGLSGKSFTIFRGLLIGLLSCNFCGLL